MKKRIFFALLLPLVAMLVMSLPMLADGAVVAEPPQLFDWEHPDQRTVLRDPRPGRCAADWICLPRAALPAALVKGAQADQRGR